MVLKVRRKAEGDIADIVEIYAFPEVVAQTAQLPGLGEKFWDGFYTSRDPNAIELVAEIDGKVVGHLGLLTNANPRRKHVASFGISVHPDFQGGGVGRALIEEMLELADNWLNLMRVELTVFADNERAIRLYERCGFEREGIARADLFRNGRYADGLRMARVRE